MNPSRFLPIVVLGEGVLLAIAFASAWLIGLALPFERPVADRKSVV